VCVCAQFLIPRQQTAVATHKDVRAPGIPRLNMGNLSSVSHQHYAASARSRYPSKKCQDVPNLSNSVGRKICQVFRTSTSTITMRLRLGLGTPEILDVTCFTNCVVEICVLYVFSHQDQAVYVT